MTVKGDCVSVETFPSNIWHESGKHVLSYTDGRKLHQTEASPSCHFLFSTITDSPTWVDYNEIKINNIFQAIAYYAGAQIVNSGDSYQTKILWTALYCRSSQNCLQIEERYQNAQSGSKCELTEHWWLARTVGHNP